MSTSFEYSTVIFRTTPEAVYEALIDRDAIDFYMGGTGPKMADGGDWKVGDRILWASEPDKFQDWGQVVTIAEPPKKLSYTWHTLSDVYPDRYNENNDHERTEVTWIVNGIEGFEEHGGAVHLRLVHSGFRSVQSEMYQGTSEGWVFIVSALKSYLEKPIEQRSK